MTQSRDSIPGSRDWHFSIPISRDWKSSPGLQSLIVTNHGLYFRVCLMHIVLSLLCSGRQLCFVYIYGLRLFQIRFIVRMDVC